MKKNNLLKAIIITFIAFIILSWIIPTGYYQSGEFTNMGTLPLGLTDIIKYPVITFTSSVFILNALVILLIGGLYGVLNKTGVYSKIVEGLTKKFEGKKTFLIISILVFSVISSLTGLTLPLFVIVPLFVAVILSLGFSKVTALLSTVGAILVGNMGSTYGFNINGYISYFLGSDINDSILYRIILFVLLVAILILFVIKTSKIEKTKKKSSKKEDTKDELVIPLYEKNIDKKKSATPLVVLGIITLILILVGMYDWYDGLGIELFNNIHTAITEFELNGYPIFKNIIGSISAIGYWTNYDLALILVIFTLVIAWIYGVKGNELKDAYISGIKKMVPVAVYSILANVIFLLMNSNSYTFYATIVDFLFGAVDKFNVVIMMLVSAIGGLLYNDFPYMLNSTYAQVSTLYANDISVIGVIMQSIHGFVMLIAPTSVILVAGLKYLNVSYTEWFKNVWKYLVSAFIAMVIIIVIMALI